MSRLTFSFFNFLAIRINSFSSASTGDPMKATILKKFSSSTLVDNYLSIQFCNWYKNTCFMSNPVFVLLFKNDNIDKIVEDFKLEISLTHWSPAICTIAIINKNGFRPVSRQQKDRFRNKLFFRLTCRLVAAFLAHFFWVRSTKVCCMFLRGGGSVKVFLRTACCCQKLS